jgi:hypothetical protein
MDPGMRALMESLIDKITEDKMISEIRRQANSFVVEGADRQNLYMGYLNGYLSGYADGAMMLLKRKGFKSEEQEEVREMMMEKSEALLRKLGIL